MIFRRFPTTFRRFPKIFQNCPEDQTNVPEHFPRISENFRRSPKIAEDCRGLSRKTRRCFDDTPTNLSTIQDTNLMSVKSSISSHVRISYRFYQFLTTRYNSGAPAARRAAKRSPIIIEKGTTRMHRNRNPCNSFLMVKMASGMDHGRVRTTTTTTTNDVAQYGCHATNTKSCSLGLQHLSHAGQNYLMLIG